MLGPRAGVRGATAPSGLVDGGASSCADGESVVTAEALTAATVGPERFATTLVGGDPACSCVSMIVNAAATATAATAATHRHTRNGPGLEGRPRTSRAALRTVD